MKRKKILVVDDSTTALLWQQLMLQQEPYDLVTATDGEAGVRVAAAERPDLILLDVMMPRMNGFEACRAIRSAPATRHVPILMVTTKSDVQSVEEGYESGCNGFITKPIDRTEYLAKVRSCLGDATPAGRAS